MVRQGCSTILCIGEMIMLEAVVDCADWWTNWWTNLGVPATNCRIVEVTPEMAADWLSNRTGKNRHVTERNWKKIQNQINQGKYRLNGETIVFSKKGILLDGQHRLIAISQSGKVVKSYIVFDIDTSMFSSYDTGRVRMGSDVLSIEGNTNCTTLSSSARLLYFHESGSMNYTSLRRTSISPDEILDVVERHPLLKESCKETAKSTYKKLITPSVSAFCHYITKLTGSSMHESFWNPLTTGENLASDKAVYVLREKLIALKGNKRSLDQLQLAMCIFKAYNLHCTDSKVKSIQLRDTDEYRTAVGDRIFGSRMKDVEDIHV